MLITCIPFTKNKASGEDLVNTKETKKKTKSHNNII